MTDKEYVDFLTKCANIPYEDYSWLKDHCYRTLERPCSPNTRNEHLAILDLIREHEERQWISERQWIPVSERLPDIHNYCMKYLVTDCYGHIRTSLFTESRGKGWWSYGGDVIAWMPLPKPYKKESEG